MKIRLIPFIALLIVTSVFFGMPPQRLAEANQSWTGGVLIHTVLPDKICVGDTITIDGGASVTAMEDAPPPLAWLPVTRVNAKAALGKITPDEVTQYNDGFYFSLTYKATAPGSETITLTVNDGLATTQERFEVEEKCDYDAFVTTVMHFRVDLDDEIFQSITHVTGTGTMTRDREGSEFYQGDGTWHLEEIVLSKPSMCVEYYIPPLIIHGPFELDGHLTDEGDTVDVILSFLPQIGESFYHGESVCIDEEGDAVYGYGSAQGGDPSLASKIEASFPTSGGSQSVELEGKGLEMVQSAGDLDYTATLTLIPR